MDVKSAYLNAPYTLSRQKALKGKNDNYVWKLKKSLVWVKTERSNLE